jgi:hypothetical protein
MPHIAQIISDFLEDFCTLSYAVHGTSTISVTDVGLMLYIKIKIKINKSEIILEPPQIPHNRFYNI